MALAGLAAALLLPSFTLSTRLPDVRPEQLLFPYALLVFWSDHRHGRRFRFGLLDGIFAALAVSTLVSILGAPLILHTRLSPRDFYEPLKIALYYALYRLARDAFARAGDRRRCLIILLAAGAISAAFGIAQYFDWLHVNQWLTPLYAPEPHLGVLRQSGRVVGTIANPNYFGIVCVVLTLAALLAFWLGLDPSPAALPAFFVAALLGLAALALLGLVMSGSRTALLALIAAMGVLFVAGILGHRVFGRPARLLAGCVGVGVLLAAAVVVVEVFPHGQVDYLGRVVDGLSVGNDASLGLRLARWRGIIDAWRPRPAPATGSAHAALTSVRATGVAPAAAEVRARDAQRKANLLQLADALDAYRRDTGFWPAPDGLAAALVPRYLAALPVDPSTNEPYLDVPNAAGYSLMARLEDPADPDYPIYGVGSGMNYLLNGDLEQGGNSPAGWDAIPGTSFAVERSDVLYGEQAVRFRGDPGHPDQRGGIFQQRYFGRPGGSPFTATVWLKLPRPVEGQLELYANVIYTDGSRADPLTRIPADMARVGVWQKVSLGILPPADKTMGFLGIYVVSDGFRGEALIDGFELVDGPVPLSFALTPQAPSSDTLGFNPEARLRLSPLIGVGPEKGGQEGAIDNEYLLYAARYGLVGIAVYLALYLGTLTLAVRALCQAQAAVSRVLAGLVALTVVAFLLFNVTAGSFYELQLMAIFWLLAGAALSARDDQQRPVLDTGSGGGV